MRWFGVMSVVAVVALATPEPTSAQAPALRPGRPVVALGGGWLGADGLGGVTAETRSAALGTTTPPSFTLFDTDSTLDGSAAIEGAVTMAVTRAFAVEVRGSVRRPTLTTTITRDAEASGTFTATEDVSEYVVDASVLYHPDWAALGSRARGYVLAGAGYLRQLHEDDALVETGSTAHAGVGARWWLRGGTGRSLAAGLTGDARWVFRRDGLTFGDAVRSLPAVSLHAFVGF
jgi:hypothetical protein